MFWSDVKLDKFTIDHIRDEIERFNSCFSGKVEMEAGKKVYNSAVELEEKLCSGPFSVNIADVNFECYYHADKISTLSSSLRYLYVFYTSARGGSDPSPKAPHFVRWSYYPMIESMNSALLCIDDPMIQECEAEDLVLAWFYGTKETSYIRLSLDIVRAVCRNLHFSYENIIFFGSSSGGYTGLYAASMLEGAMAIAINPQVYIQSWIYTKKFERLTGIDLKEKDSLCRNDLIRLIKDNKKSRYVIIFNAMSNEDYNSQLSPFCADMEIFPHYGLNKKNNVLLWIYNAKGTNAPHNAFETRNIFQGIDHISKRFYAGEQPEKMQAMALFINRYWEEYYDWRFKIYNQETSREKRSDRAEFYIMNLLNTARIDVKLTGSMTDLRVLPSDTGAIVSKPAWFQGQGPFYVITSYKENMKLRLETSGNGKLQILLKGLYILNTKKEPRNLPLWIDYTSMKVDGVEMLKEPCPVWHNKPFSLLKDVSGRNVFNVELSWKAHT